MLSISPREQAAPRPRGQIMRAILEGQCQCPGQLNYGSRVGYLAATNTLKMILINNRKYSRWNNKGEKSRIQNSTACWYLIPTICIRKIINKYFKILIESYLWLDDIRKFYFLVCPKISIISTFLNNKGEQRRELLVAKGKSQVAEV